MTAMIAGVDGCRSGWVAAIAPAADLHRAELRLASSVIELLDALPIETLAIDMPIGLPDRVGRGGRAAEAAVRPLLGGRQSSVFSVPAREAVEAPDYGAACAAALRSSEPPRSIAKQCYGLFPKIRELDGLLRARRDLAAYVYEVHPEVAFWRLNGERALGTPKKVKGRPHEPGLTERRRLLVSAGFDPALLAAPPPRGAGRDDVLDAAACLAVAQRLAAGLAKPFPDPPERDRFGLPIAIWA
jgi:predicted RNase H-like nuclease